ncbi:MAG TPA: PAC2 family protein [Patescibacteria group bacterium]|nr:PAC2 family protein [Patescibacteria group bacterium]
MSLLDLRDPGDLVAPLVVVSFDGWVDAGSAATTAAARLAEGAETIGTFEADRLYDYRARRPTLEIVDGRPARLTWPELTVRRARLAERDLLVLSGPEPDYRWHELEQAAVDLARRLEVAAWISLGAIPAATPHTRPVTVLGTESRPGLLRGGVTPGPDGILRVPSAALSVLDLAVSRTGVATIGYYAQIPHYVSGEYPPASVELLRLVGQHLDGEIAIGELRDEARRVLARLDAATAADGTTQAYVERLEAMVDEARRPAGNDLITEIEQFLRDQGGRNRS